MAAEDGAHDTREQLSDLFLIPGLGQRREADQIPDEHRHDPSRRHATRAARADRLRWGIDGRLTGDRPPALEAELRPARDHGRAGPTGAHGAVTLDPSSAASQALAPISV